MTQAVRWPTEALYVLADLRSIGLSYKECARYFPRTAQACKAAVQYHQLGVVIADKKGVLIGRIVQRRNGSEK
jgi:hypothetical protein